MENSQNPQTKKPELQVGLIALGPLSTNTYSVSFDGETAIIDPSGGGDPEFSAMKILGNAMELDEQAEIKYILLTHGHYDHTFSARALKYLIFDKTKKAPKILINREDAIMLSDREKAAASIYGDDSENFTPTAPDGYLEETTDTLSLGKNFKIPIRILETPGHSRGSVVITIGNLLFTGDTLFKNTVGRCDGYSGDGGSLKQSIIKLKEIFYSPTDQQEFFVFPGHGATTLISDEFLNNPFFNYDEPLI